MENYDSSMILGGSGLNVQSHRAALEAVTREDLAKAAQTLQLHSTYFLKGVQE